jgi:hypothetical protein
VTEASGHERRGSDGGNRDAPVILYPLDFADALRGPLTVKPRAERGGRPWRRLVSI